MRQLVIKALNILSVNYTHALLPLFVDIRFGDAGLGSEQSGSPWSGVVLQTRI